MKAMLVITLTNPDGSPYSELRLWHSWDTVTVDPEEGVVTVTGQTFNQTYPLNGLIKIEVRNTTEEVKSSS